MQIEYDPGLIEQAVFLASQEDRQLECELHAAVDPLYELPEGRALNRTVTVTLEYEQEQ